MNAFRHLRLGLLLSSLLLSGLLILRAADQPAPTPDTAPADKPVAPATPSADQNQTTPAPAPAEAPAAAPEAPAPAAPAVAPVAPAAPQTDTPAVQDTEADATDKLAEKARQEAEKIAEKAQADAEKIAEEAHAKAERIAEEARANAEKAAEKARAKAERISEKAHAAAVRAQEKIQSRAERAHRHAGGVSEDASGDRVAINDNNVVAAGVVVKHDALAVMGDLIVEGEVMNDAVSVMGNNTVNGTVHGNVVSVMGDISLGPKAVVDGDLVVIMGEINRDPGAVVKGNTQFKTGGPHVNLESMGSWWNRALKLGRPLAIGVHLGWLWIVTGFAVAFYALLGLIFPKKICSCGDKLADEPGMAILAGVLGILALPVLFVLLLITVIGIPVAFLVLPLGCVLIAMFGKAAIYGLIGRRLTGDSLHPALSVIIGALLMVLVYLIPYLGGLVLLLVWFLGFGCAVLNIFSKAPKASPAVPPVLPPTPGSGPVPPVMPAAASGFAAAASMPGTDVAPPVISEGATTSDAGAATAAPVPPPAPAAVPVTADTLPRAGFWIRVAAAFLDLLLVFVPTAILGLFHFGPGIPFLLLAAYHAAMWKHKGTTIGGIICHLKVVRIDDKPIDWGVAIVRAVSAFLSLIVSGLGFIWVAFDDDKQSWHDKVAGTTIVRVPKGTPLL